MCGEGRGHATRVQTVVEMLVPKHRFVLLASRDAYHQLYDRYQDHPLVSVRRLPGLCFSYRDRRLDYWKSCIDAGPFLWRLRSMVEYVQQMLQREQPALAITDFEPLLPRAAKKLGIPWISLDHQHFLTVSDFSTLPYRFRWRAMFLRLSIPIFYSGQSGEAVSSFQHFPPRRGTQHIPRLGVLLRRTVVEHREQICDQGHVVVYVRKHAPDSLWKALAACGRRAIVYGLGAMSHSQSFDFAATDIQFKNISDEGFVADLASASCLITTAGNQLVGESLFLKKPVLAIPEDGNYEQELNALLVQRSGGGWSIKFENLTSHLLQQFLIAVPSLQARLEQMDVSGNEGALDFIQQFLPESGVDDEQPFAFRNSWEPEVSIR